MVKFAHLSIVLLLVCSSHLAGQTRGVAAEDEPKLLPSILLKNSEGSSTESILSYRFVYELQLIGTGKTLFAEEWASSEEQAFRLDIFEHTSSTRSTYLANKKTGENFHYKPFKCSLVYDFRETLDAELKDKFPDPRNPLAGAAADIGVGSIWLHAMKLKSEYLEAKEATRRTQLAVLGSFAKFTIPGTREYPYDLDFYFRDSDGKDAGSISIIDLSLNGKSMRIKFIEAEIPWKPVDAEEIGVLDLPVGYGCQRAANFDHPFATPIDGLGSRFIPHILQLDIVTLQPADRAHDFNRWKSHSTSVRMVTGRVSLDDDHRNDYIVLESQDYAPEPESPIIAGSKVRRATLRRLKQVWDLGRDGLTLGKPIEANSSRQSAIYFEIDERTGRCLNYGESQLEESASVEFSTVPQSGGAQAQAQTKAQASTTTTQVAGITLNTEFIDTLLTTATGYHLIKEGEGPNRNLREFIYERRVDKFEMKNKLGEVIWNGPVSFVRKHALYYPEKNNKPSLGEEKRTVVAINFLSNELDRIVAKIQVNVAEKRFIHEAYFHRELDVSSCYKQMSEVNVDNRRRRKTKRDARSLEFAIGYPIQWNQTVDRLATGDQAEANIYEQFVRSMFRLSENRLDLFQLNNIAIDFGPEVVIISSKLLETPSLLSFAEESGLRLARNLRFTELKANEERCAESCVHYNCPMFSYCPETKSCDIALNLGQEKSALVFEQAPSCDAFTLKDTGKRGVEPKQFIHKLRHAILAQTSVTDSPDGKNLLALAAEYRGVNGVIQRLNLIPSYIESGLFSSEDVEVMIGDAESDEVNKSNPKQEMLASRFDDDKTLIPEYVVARENGRYQLPKQVNEDFPMKAAELISLEDCESLCDEVDCRSYSYCQLEQVCIVSQLHETSSIQKHVEEEDLCYVMARDYLSKFHEPIQVRRPDKSLGKYVRGETSRDCANQCISDDEFKCRSFLSCPMKTGEGRHCYLLKAHTLNAKEATVADERGWCELHSRSFLDDFDKFLGRALPHSNDYGQEIVLRGFGAESCAAECASREGACRAFQVCGIRSDTGQPTTSPTCSILDSGTQNSSKNLEKILVNEEACTTFILSQLSELNLLNNAKLLVATDEESTNYELDLISGRKGFSGFWTLLQVAMLITGMAIGYLAVLAYQKTQ